MGVSRASGAGQRELDSDRRIDVARVALRRRRTKIVATVGPASSDPAMIALLIDAGVNVFRLNFSHGTHEQHGETYRAIRAAAGKARRHVAVLADLCGPKIRVGRFPNGFIVLTDGQEVTLTTRRVPGAAGLIPFEYDGRASDLEPGHRVLLDDGNLQLEVIESGERDLRCRVVNGGVLKDRKGVNLPGVKVSAPSLTEKDRRDATFAAQLGVDFMALSFVRSAADVQELDDHLAGLDRRIPIVAKIEKPEALEVIGEILEAADALMVARGDLGVELPAEEVPLVQSELVRLAVAARKPAIVATQMLESMVENPRPTRAEVTDVAWAAMAGADAVMLSAETAAGRFPLRAVQSMDRILRLVEGDLWARSQFADVVRGRRRPDPEADPQGALSAAISQAAALVSRTVMARAIVVPCRSGRTARVVAADRPAAPIIALTADPALARQLALVWGTFPVLAHPDHIGQPVEYASQLPVHLDLAAPGQCILLVWDASMGKAMRTPAVALLQAAAPG